MQSLLGLRLLFGNVKVLATESLGYYVRLYRYVPRSAMFILVFGPSAVGTRSTEAEVVGIAGSFSRPEISLAFHMERMYEGPANHKCPRRVRGGEHKKRPAPAWRLAP